MRIALTSIFVDDQQSAEAFYTDVLGFQLRHKVPIGADFWLTVTAPEDQGGPELLLEPASHPAVEAFRAAMTTDGIPVAQFAVTDIHSEYDRLSGLGVRFTQPPVEMGPAITAVFDDTCGNLIQLLQPTADL
ncbi:VOC family protein [Williamsia sp.]|uniref:VOC family protein n=1 Tax=Williamsia sp. TaxID=1872085 RepID=UPI001A3558F7|nr:VOC family protein [Williamsia sp.]MBJ7287387.1 VOC family protein [Williamsia sp.]